MLLGGGSCICKGGGKGHRIIKLSLNNRHYLPLMIVDFTHDCKFLFGDLYMVVRKNFGKPLRGASLA